MYVCMYVCMKQHTNTTGFILGQPLLKRYYVSYERGDKRMGFAPAVPDCSKALL